MNGCSFLLSSCLQRSVPSPYFLEPLPDPPPVGSSSPSTASIMASCQLHPQCSRDHAPCLLTGGSGSNPPKLLFALPLLTSKQLDENIFHLGHTVHQNGPVFKANQTDARVCRQEHNLLAFLLLFSSFPCPLLPLPSLL